MALALNKGSLKTPNRIFRLPDGLQSMGYNQ